MAISSVAFKHPGGSDNVNIIFLHHSTGQYIWNGNRTTALSKRVGKINTRLSHIFYKQASLPRLFKRYNKDHNTNFNITESVFPKAKPYGWKNYPYDYFNIWVKNAGNNAFMEEPTLEILTKKFQVIIFKHCFPVSNILANADSIDINSEYRSIENYMLQYLALRDKLSEFKNTKFILFTGAVRVKSEISEDEAKRAREFFTWVRNEWDLPGNNIYIWDLYYLQAGGGLYFKDKNAYSGTNSHPNKVFSEYASELLFNRIIDIITTDGSQTSLSGERNQENDP